MSGLASPRHGFTIMNRLSMENLTEPITKDLDFQLQDPFLLYRNARLVIHGIWFYDKQDCQRIAHRMKILTHQEQIVAQSQGGWLSPGGGGAAGRGRAAAGGGGGGGGGGGRGGGRGNNEAKAVDIIQMLTKARSEYDKDKTNSEPKEIGGSSVLCGNPNLIKPIPVKPNAQDSEGAEPKTISLATLFGSQHQHHHASKPHSAPPVAASTSTGKVTRPPVARTLTYDDAVNSGRNVTSATGNITLAGSSDGGVRPVVGEDGGNVVAALQGPAAAHQPPGQPQHCPAIAKLMQGQRSVAGVGGVLQTLSESPENRLCDNGVPLEHHHHHLYHHHHRELHPHHHQQQLQPDPIKRLLQTQPTPQLATSFTSTASPCCSNPPPLQHNPLLPSQPGGVDSVSCPHLQVQQSQQLFFNLTKSQTEMLNSHQTPCKAQGTGLSSQMQGVVSPHELLHKLQLVQQEQNLTSHDPPRPYPGLAPRFLGPNQNQDSGSSLVPPPTTGQKAALQFQVISPQRIPATVAPTLLLSPSVFTQTKTGSGLPAAAQDSCSVPTSLPRPPLQDEVRAPSRSQLQAALLHLIQTDSSFLDSIYEAYVSRFSNGSSSKY
ncbi:mRNA-decapping enzyme 1B isoform X2 [Kryptolebias marmoratus]|uniref:mRNA-decapping enzyme 1B isoform X2 n=1 Tax=Kryptolebias marmoratus TaxID=37003 RepID=UPI0018AC8E86|nr:mRNA-decapping enzyme 1B isoform X2 [Kryptolebias marmoratus]